MLPNTGLVPSNGLMRSANTLRALHSSYANYRDGYSTSWDFRVANLYQVNSAITVEEVSQYVGSYMAFNTTEIWSIVYVGIGMVSRDTDSPYRAYQLLRSYPHSTFVNSYRDGDYLYVPVQPLLLTPGTYAILGDSFGGQGFLQFNPGTRSLITDTGNNSISYLGTSYNWFWNNTSLIGGTMRDGDTTACLIAGIRYSLGNTTGIDVPLDHIYRVAYIVPTGTVGQQGYPNVLGMDFDVVRPITITELGVFDSGGDGIVGTIYCEIWSRVGSGANAVSGSKLAMQSFSASDMGTLIGSSRHKSISPIVLAPGSYTIVSYGYSDADRNGNYNLQNRTWYTDSGLGAISFGPARYSVAPSDNGNSIGSTLDTASTSVASTFAAGTFKYYVN